MRQPAGNTGVGNEFQNLGHATEKVFDELEGLVAWWQFWIVSKEQR